MRSTKASVAAASPTSSHSTTNSSPPNRLTVSASRTLASGGGRPRGAPRHRPLAERVVDALVVIDVQEHHHDASAAPARGAARARRALRTASGSAARSADRAGAHGRARRGALALRWRPPAGGRPARPESRPPAGRRIAALNTANSNHAAPRRGCLDRRVQHVVGNAEHDPPARRRHDRRHEGPVAVAAARAVRERRQAACGTPRWLGWWSPGTRPVPSIRYPCVPRNGDAREEPVREA